jgi:hypothetical protein
MVPSLQKQLHIEIKSRVKYGAPGPRFYFIQFLEKYIFEQDEGWNAWTLLARPVAGKAHYYSLRHVQELSALERLPAEILAEIIGDDGLAPEDVIALGLSSEVLWIHMLNHIRYFTYTESGCLAGEQMAVLGTNLLTLPPPFEEKYAMKLSVNTYPFDHTQTGMSRQKKWEARYQFSAIDQDSVQQKWSKVFDKASTSSKLPLTILSTLRTQLATHASIAGNINPTDPWLLRNLTTKEYVRVTPGDGPDHYLGIVASGVVASERWSWRIDHVLLLRICWNRKFFADPQPQWMPFKPIQQGVWAGHEFDVVPCEVLLDDEGDGVGGKWRDVTREVLEEACSVMDGFEGLGCRSSELKEDFEERIQKIQAMSAVLHEARMTLSQI